MKEEQIVKSARELFGRYGYKKVSMDEIAKNASVTKRTVYKYFSSKEELLKYFIAEEVEQMKKIVERVERKNLDFFDAIHEIIYNLIKYTRKAKFLQVILKESETFKEPVILECLKTIDLEIQKYIKQKLVLAIEKDHIVVKDVDITAFLIYKMYMALMFEWTENSKKIDEKQVADNIVYIIKNGICKKGNE